MSEQSGNEGTTDCKEKLLQSNDTHNSAGNEATKSGADSKDIKAKDISTKEAYFESLNAWAKQAAISQNAMAMFPLYLLNSYPHLFQQNRQPMTTTTNTTTTTTNTPATAANFVPPQNRVGANAAAAAGNQGPFGAFRILDDLAQQELINRYGGYNYVVAPFWKRVLAEAIDWLILLILKIVITFTIMNIFDLDMGFEINKDAMRKALDEDDVYASILEASMDFITLSSDLLLIEFLTKLIVCFYEALWTTFYNGATPGKTLMSIKIQYVEAVIPLQAPPPPQFFFQPQREPVRALLFPAETPSLPRAFMRAVGKNLVMTLLFPICLVMVFFKNNRTAYDVATKTIVVEANANPGNRRQQ